MNDFIHCPHFEECSGCEIRRPVQDLELLEEARKYFGRDVPLVQGPSQGFRMRAKLAVRSGNIGLFRRGTHEVVSIPRCFVHDPAITNVLDLLNKAIVELCIESYDEGSGQGVLRYIQCIVQRRTKLVALTLVVTKLTPGIEQLAQVLYDTGLMHSVWINCNTASDNRIFGPKWHHLYGEPYLWEEVLGTPLCFSPGSFGQANLFLFEKLVEEIKNEIPTKAHIAEFYAGVGSIGLCLADKAASLTCVEVNPEAEGMFWKAAPEALKPKLQYFVGDAGRFFHLINDCDTIIVDPPRKGLDKPLLEALKKANQKTLIYVSCGWSSFQRDCDQLLNAGWTLKRVTLYLFFPGSKHLETLAFFTNCK